jgi:hypothetical protein
VDDDKLPRLPDLGNARRVNVEPCDVRAELLPRQNLVHPATKMPLRRDICWPTIGKRWTYFAIGMTNDSLTARGNRVYFAAAFYP